MPEVDRDKKQVAFTFFVDPAAVLTSSWYMTNARTRDAARPDAAAARGLTARIQRSKVRIRRLGYFDDVNIETPPVPGAATSSTSRSR